MPQSARDLQAKIQAKIEEENNLRQSSLRSLGAASTPAAKQKRGGSAVSKSTATSSSSDGSAHQQQQVVSSAANYNSRVPEPITATEEQEDGSNLASCNVVAGDDDGRRSAVITPADRLRDKLLSRSTNRSSNNNNSSSNPNSQRSLYGGGGGDLDDSHASTKSRTPEERLRDKIARANNSNASGHGSNNSFGSLLSSHSPPTGGGGDSPDSAGGRKSVTPDERMRDKLAQGRGAVAGGATGGAAAGAATTGAAAAGGGSPSNEQQHHRPDQVQDLMDVAAGSDSAANTSTSAVGARYVRGGLSTSTSGQQPQQHPSSSSLFASKAEQHRDERVGAFAVQPSTGTSARSSSASGGGPSPSMESLGLTEEEQRWLSEESSSGHPPPSSVDTRSQHAISGQERAPASSVEEGGGRSSFSGTSGDNSSMRIKDDDVILVCGMKKKVFIGVVVAFAILAVAIIGVAVGVVVASSSKQSSTTTPSSPASSPTGTAGTPEEPSPQQQGGQTVSPAPVPAEPQQTEPNIPNTIPESICQHDIVELPRQSDELDAEFGSSVAISRNVAVVGSTGCESCQGSAFVYERTDGAGWVQVAQLSPAESYLGDSFGKSVDTEGDIIVVGGNCKVELADYDDHPAGCAHVFVRTVDGWTQEATLIGDDGVSIPVLSYASSLAIDDGLLIVGEPSASGEFVERGQQSGFVYIYSRHNDGTWVEEAKVRPSDAQDKDEFGYSVDLDEGQAVIGAPRRHSGMAYVFSRQLDGTWLERMKLVPDDASNGDSFGRSVSITQYGTIAVGATGDDDNGFSSGSVYVFEDVDGTGSWTESAKLTPNDGSTSDRFGSSVAIFRETIVVGATGVDDQGENSGALYSFAYDRAESSWRQTSKMVAPNAGEKSEFGSQIDVYGSTAIVGSFYNAQGLLEGNVDDTGRAYAIDLLC